MKENMGGNVSNLKHKKIWKNLHEYGHEHLHENVPEHEGNT
jgi:hypothetical protein